MNLSRFTPDFITELAPNEIFVFGSNVDGIHGAGAAKHARAKFGAEYGIGEGMTGRCYAIPTVDFKLKRSRKHYPIDQLEQSILRFLKVCEGEHELVFLLTPIGCGLAGFTEEEVAGLFAKYRDRIPDNIIFPKAFADIILRET